MSHPPNPSYFLLPSGGLILHTSCYSQKLPHMILCLAVIHLALVGSKAISLTNGLQTEVLPRYNIYRLSNWKGPVRETILYKTWDARKSLPTLRGITNLEIHFYSPVHPFMKGQSEITEGEGRQLNIATYTNLFTFISIFYIQKISWEVADFVPWISEAFITHQNWLTGYQVPWTSENAIESVSPSSGRM